MFCISLLTTLRIPSAQYLIKFFKNYFITDIASPEIDREQLKFFCGQCGKQAQRVKRWKLHNKNFNADFYCKNCDTRFTGRVSFKKRFDGVKVNRKIIPKAEKKE